MEKSGRGAISVGHGFSSMMLKLASIRSILFFSLLSGPSSIFASGVRCHEPGKMEIGWSLKLECGVRSPEAQAYLVNPDLDVDGNPRRVSLSTTPAPDTDDEHRHMHHSPASVSDASIMDAGNMPADHSQMAMDFSPASTVLSSHQHHMTASMIRVERQHLWFMIVGIAIGLFKFISDSEFFRSRVVHGIWPICTVLLGLMLVVYRE